MLATLFESTLFAVLPHRLFGRPRQQPKGIVHGTDQPVA
jgi:hypothetical protein